MLWAEFYVRAMRVSKDEEEVKSPSAIISKLGFRMSHMAMMIPFHLEFIPNATKATVFCGQICSQVRCVEGKFVRYIVSRAVVWPPNRTIVGTVH